MPTVYMTNTWQGGMNTPLRMSGGAEKRVIDSVAVERRDRAMAIIVRDHCDVLAGQLQLLLDADGTAETSFDYIYSGEPFRGREIGLELPLDAACQTLTWRRQSEWDVYPDDQIGRPQGTAKARRVSEAVGNALRGVPNGGPSWRVYPAMPEETRYRNHPKSPWPWTSDLELSEAKTWPWSLDMNDGSGTRDFASTKFHVFEARLCDAEGRGVAVFSDGRANVRAGLSKAAVLLHLWQPGEAREVPRGARLEGRFTISLAPPPLKEY